MVSVQSTRRASRRLSRPWPPRKGCLVLHLRVDAHALVVGKRQVPICRAPPPSRIAGLRRLQGLVVAHVLQASYEVEARLVRSAALSEHETRASAPAPEKLRPFEKVRNNELRLVVEASAVFAHCIHWHITFWAQHLCILWANISIFYFSCKALKCLYSKNFRRCPTFVSGLNSIVFLLCPSPARP